MKKSQHHPTYVARWIAEQTMAQRVADHLVENLDPAQAVCAVFERPDRRWQVELYFAARPDPAPLRQLVAQLAGNAAAAGLTVDNVPRRDWVKQSLAGLTPVRAGRFVVHGAHDRARVARNRIGIEIEAATAFGTGHHATTRGCLIALDALARRARPRCIHDLGTGSGVLAIAAARLWRTAVLATDIDIAAVRAARGNARRNGVGALVQTVHAAGLRAPQIVKRGPFDLVLANILLAPLQRLAAPLARNLSPNGRVVLSGLLAVHGEAALSAYRAQGLMLERRIALDGWETLVMLAASR